MHLYELSNISYNNLFSRQQLSWFPTDTLKLNGHYEETLSTGFIQLGKIWLANLPIHPSQNTINSCSCNSTEERFLSK